MIRKMPGGGYELLSKHKGENGKRKRLSKKHISREAAQKRERAVQYFKHHDEDVRKSWMRRILEKCIRKLI